MSHTVTIKSGLVDVVLPDGNRYQGGDTVTLSDAEYAMLSPTAAAALFGSTIQKSDTGQDSSVFNVTDYGAKGDGNWVLDAAMNSGSAVLTSASNPWTTDSVGAYVMVPGAGAGGETLVGTISTFTNAGFVTLSVAASTTVTGKCAMWAHDDSGAIQAAVNAATSYALAHSGSATVYIPSAPGKFYGTGINLQTGTATKGNAQITLPIVPTTGPKVTLTITGPASGAGVQHWQQTTPNTTGATLVSFGLFANASAQSTSINNNGNPCVIGGPAQPGGYGVNPGVFSNMYVDIANMSILTAHSIFGYTYGALDLSGVACARIRDFGYATTGTVAGNSYANPNAFATGASTGLLMPANGNNDLCMINNVICGGGYTYALLPTEHTDIYGLRILYSWAALCPVGNYFGSVGAAHSINGTLISIEQCTYLLHFVGVGSSGIGPVIYLKIDTETSLPRFGDRSSGTALAAARGEVVLGGLFTPSGLTLDGPVGFSIRNVQDAFPVKTVTSAYTVGAFDEVIVADATSAAFTVTLPTAVGRTRRITVKRINSSANNVTVGTTSGQTIDGAATQSLASQWASITVVPTATGNWIKV